MNHTPDELTQTLMALGIIFMLGLAADLLGRRTPLPRVTTLLLCGILVGPSMLDLFPASIVEAIDLITVFTLLMIGFLLGGRLNRETFQTMGRALLSVSLNAAVGAALLVIVGLLLVGVDLPLAILLGSIASATEPAATLDAVKESENTGPFADLLLAIVALDDAWALLLFSVGLAMVVALVGNSGEISPLMLMGRDIFGGLALGAVIGVPAAYLSGRIRPGEPTLVEALGLVSLCGGFAIWLDVSFLLAAITMGAVVANLATHHQRPFHAIEEIEWPFLVVFFLLAGATLELHGLITMGGIGITYLLCRTVGKVGGGYLGAALAGCDQPTRRWIGAALLPQAGAALGMALVAAGALPQYRQQLLALVIGTSVVFELFGPLCTRLALGRAAAAKSG